MVTNKTLIIGMGEVGSALAEILKTQYKIITRDKDIAIDNDEKIEIMHICFPFFDKFIIEVLKYIEIYSPKYVIIHSTTPVGITKIISEKIKNIYIFHSPIRGTHPNLQEDILKYIKYLSFSPVDIYEAEKIRDYFKAVGIETKLLPYTKTTELGKMLSLARYAMEIAFAKVQDNLCKEFNVEYYPVVTDFEMTRNEHVKESLKQPIIHPFTDYVSGHCVCEVTQLLLDQIDVPLLKEAQKINRGTKIWDNCNIYPGAKIGKGCSIGFGTEIDNGVTIGNSVRIGAGCFIPSGVTIKDDVFIGPGVYFANDKYPPSDKKEWGKTLVGENVSIGIRSVILPGVNIGKNVVIGAGSIVTKDVPDGEQWYGMAACSHGKSHLIKEQDA